MNSYRMTIPLLASLAALAFACSKDEGRTAEPTAAERTAGDTTLTVAETQLDTAPGEELDATATFTEQVDAVRVDLTVQNATPGKHGVHVHEKGDCSDIPGKSMGAHFAPNAKEHGLPHEPERHLGDLGNIEIADDGTGTLEITVPDATLAPGEPTSFRGRALVIHAGEDTGEGESGESGPPIACGVIE